MHKINFIEDKHVDAVLDKKLIDAISTCFPEQPVFKEKRYFKEMPPYRWFIEENDRIIAHAALHIKTITVGDKKVDIGGVAEVCVLPDYRGQSLAKLLLKEIDKWLIEHHYKYAMLFGKTSVYTSSGYFDIQNEIKYVDYKTNEIKIEKNIEAMVKLLSPEPWLTGTVDLNGPTF